MEPDGSWLRVLDVCHLVTFFSIHALLSCLFKIEFFIIIFPSTPRSLESFLALRFSHQNLNVRLLSFPYVLHDPPSNPAWVDHPNDIWRGVLDTKYLIVH